MNQICSGLSKTHVWPVQQTRLPGRPFTPTHAETAVANGLIAKEPGVDLASVVMSSTDDVTGLLVAWGEGDRAAHSELMEIVYSELKGLAKAYLRREYANQSLRRPPSFTRPTSSWWISGTCSGATGATSSASRRRPCAVSLSIAHGRPWRRSEAALTRKRVPAAELHAIQEPPDVNVLALDAALSRLETVEPRWSRLVELRFFVGLSVEETAAAVGLSPATVKRDWSLARAWLYREIGAGGNTDSRDSDCASEHLAPVVPVKTRLRGLRDAGP